MTRVLAVVGSPHQHSFVHALTDAATSVWASRGAEIELHDLYDEGFQPVAPATEARTTGLDVEAAIAATADPVIRAHRGGLSRADFLVVAHPNWWGKPPAIMAGWMDRVLVPGLAYRLDDGESLPTSLLDLDGVLVLNTGDTPPEREAMEFGDPLDSVWRRCVGTYLGSAPVARLLAGPMSGATVGQRADWLAQARDLAEALAAGAGQRTG